MELSSIKFIVKVTEKAKSKSKQLNPIKKPLKNKANSSIKKIPKIYQNSIILYKKPSNSSSNSNEVFTLDQIFDKTQK